MDVGTTLRRLPRGRDTSHIWRMSGGWHEEGRMEDSMQSLARESMVLGRDGVEWRGLRNGGHPM